MDNVTKALKIELWKRFGTKEYPAEWDGFVYGGGKLSQRYWEYFKAIEMLDLQSDSVVLDIGGGSPVTGVGFFPSLMSKHVKKVIIMDKNIDNIKDVPPNIELVKNHASAKTLQEMLTKNDNITHVSCVSVLEHVEQPLREELVKTINDNFKGRIFVATFEYHAKIEFFRNQLTAKTTSDLFKFFTQYYVSEFESSPVKCKAAFKALTEIERKYSFFPLLIKTKNVLVRTLRQKGPKQDQFPRWHPVAVKFERI